MAEDDENRQLSAILLPIGSPRSAYANRYVRGTAFVENERANRITAQTFATGTYLVSAYADDFWMTGP